MGSDVFVLPSNISTREFAQLFLASSDFEMNSLKEMARRIGLRIGANSKSDLITLLFRKLNLEGNPDHLNMIVNFMVFRAKEWISLQKGEIRRFPELADPRNLILKEGDSKWHGPINITEENGEETFWYVKPVFVENWIKIADKDKFEKNLLRWLCFARVTREFISLHWRGFTYAENPSTGSNIQFPYWNHIPYLFEEIKLLVDARTEYVNLQSLMLDKLWDKYQSLDGYNWKHIRIRAESNGVSLNAHAGAADEQLSVKGVLHLAETIRKSIQDELHNSYKYILPQPEKFDSVILRTLIKKYGALSYEFSLEKESLIFKTHSYFGVRPALKSPDSFAHMRMFSLKKDIIAQLHFLIEFIRSNEKDENNKPVTISMFQE